MCKLTYFPLALISLFVLLFGLVWSQASYANMAAGKVTQSSCVVGQPIGQQFYRYLTAVAKGILTTKTVMAENTNSREIADNRSAYAKRVFQTRVWTIRDSQKDAINFQSKVCLPEGKNNEMLSQQVVDDIVFKQSLESDVYRQVYKTITALYPC